MNKQDVTLQEIFASGEFDLVSFRENSIPGAGSPCVSVEDIDRTQELQKEKVIIHRTGDITVKDARGFYVRFWKAIR